MAMERCESLASVFAYVASKASIRFTMVRGLGWVGLGWVYFGYFNFYFCRWLDIPTIIHYMISCFEWQQSAAAWDRKGCAGRVSGKYGIFAAFVSSLPCNKRTRGVIG